MAFSHGPFTFDSLTSGDEDSFDFSGPGGTGLSAANTAGYWSWDEDSTTSSDVGPDHGEDGDPDGFVYTEMSSQTSGDIWTLEYNSDLDASSNSIEIDFYWCMRGDSVRATIQVQTNENSAGWVNRGTATGYGDETIPGTAGATTWFNKVVDLAGLVSHANTRVRLYIVATTDPTTDMWHDDIGIDTITITGTDLGGSFDQTSFRGRNDDDNEEDATWKAVVNTNWNQVQDENFRVRFLVQEDDDVEELNVEFQLQYNLDSGGWNDVNATSSVVRSSTSSEFTSGADTTQQLGSGTFITNNDCMDDVDGLAGGANLDFSTTANQEVEVEFCCQIRSADTSRGDTIQLRLVKEADTAFDTYTNTPTLTIPTGAGMALASAEYKQGTAAAENPAAFDFSRALPWGAITLALRPSSGAGSKDLAPSAEFTELMSTETITVQDGAGIDGLSIIADVQLTEVIDLDGVTIDGALDFDTAGTYNLTDCTIGEVTNSSGGAVTINANNTTITTNTGPNITVNNSVTLTVTVKTVSGTNIQGARVYIEAAAGGDLTEGDEIINDTTSAAGVVTDSFNYTSDQPVVGRVRKSSSSPLYKTSVLSGTITTSGFEATIFLIGDE